MVIDFLFTMGRKSWEEFKVKEMVQMNTEGLIQIEGKR